MPKFEDHYSLSDADITRKTKGGYVVATPRVARTGIQLYAGDEVGRPTKPIVRVYRPEEEVFAMDAMRSFAHIPVTDDHPSEEVNSHTWSDTSRGHAGGDVARDGDFVRVPLVVMDHRLVQKVDAGKREISMGYTADIDWTEGVTPAGQHYDAVMRNIRGNHYAFVDNARGGSKLRFGDASSGAGEIVDTEQFARAVSAALQGNISKVALADAADAFLGKSGKYPLGKGGTVYLDSVRAIQADATLAGDHDVAQAAQVIIDSVADATTTKPQTTTPPKKERTTMTDKTVIIDGISVLMSDTADQVVQRHIKTLTDSAADLTKRLTDAQSDVAKLQSQIANDTTKYTTDVAAKDAEIATLKASLADSVLTPDKLDALVKDRENVVSIAKAMLPTVVVDGKTLPEIKRQIVDAKLGDTAKGWSDEQVAVSFDTLGANVKVVGDGVTRTVQAFSAPNAQHNVKDAALDKRDARVRDAWKGPAANA